MRGSYVSRFCVGANGGSASILIRAGWCDWVLHQVAKHFTFPHRSACCQVSGQGPRMGQSHPHLTLVERGLVLLDGPVSAIP